MTQGDVHQRANQPAKTPAQPAHETTRLTSSGRSGNVTMFQRSKYRQVAQNSERKGNLRLLEYR